MNNQELINEVRRLTLGPNTTDLTLDDDDILKAADEVIRQDVITELVDLAQGYLVVEEAIPTVAGQSKYPIPKRAAGSQVEFLSLDSGTNSRDMYWISPKQRNRFQQSKNVAYVQGDDIVTPGSNSGTLEIQYYLDPGQLAAPTSYAMVTGVDTGTGVVTFDSVPPSWDETFKYTAHRAEHSGQPRFLEKSISALTGTTITFSDAIDGSAFGEQAPEIGDYVCFAGCSAIPQIPVQLHGVTAVGVARRLAWAHGDMEMAGMLKEEFAEKMMKAKKFLDRRVDQKQLIMNYNSMFRRGYGALYRKRLT